MNENKRMPIINPALKRRIKEATKAAATGTSQGTKDTIAKAKSAVKQGWHFSKANPDTVLLGFIGLVLLDIEEDVDELES